MLTNKIFNASALLPKGVFVKVPECRYVAAT